MVSVEFELTFPYGAVIFRTSVICARVRPNAGTNLVRKDESHESKRPLSMVHTTIWSSPHFPARTTERFPCIMCP